MARYIAFLRAVNVGGRFVKMEQLRDLFTELGYKSVRTHIQSGNVFFETAKKRSALVDQIEAHLAGELGFEVSVLLRTPDEVEAALKRDAFKKVKITAQTRLSVIFVSEPLPKDLKWPIRSSKGEFELLQSTAGEVFAVHRTVNGRPSNPAAYIEKTFKVRATSRFFATLIKISEAENS